MSDPPHTACSVRRVLGVILAVAVLLRLLVGLVYDHVYHPDETFQYLEQAHRLAFDYGHVPWEYRFGIRSWAIPGLLAALLWVAKILHLDDPGLYIPMVKTFLALLSASMCWSGYTIGVRLSSRTAGYLAAASLCVWYELVYFGTRPLSAMIATPFLLGALALMLGDEKQRKPVWVGILAALAIVFRLQLAPAVLVMGITAIILWRRRRKDILMGAVAFVVACLIFGGLLDYLTWGRPFISAYNNYLFNKVYKISELFGTSPWHWYLVSLLAASGGLLAIAAGLGLATIRRSWPMVGVLAALIVSHSLIGHKEYRFIIAVPPVALTLLAVGVVEVARVLGGRRSWVAAGCFAVVLVVSIVGMLHALPYQKRAYDQPLLRHDDKLAAYDRLAQEEDVEGVIDLSSTWYWTGGYYRLHRDVPIYFMGQPLTRTLGPRRYGQYASHIICPGRQAPIAGFDTIATMGDLELRRRTQPADNFMVHPKYTRNMASRVDSWHKPNVRFWPRSRLR